MPEGETGVNQEVVELLRQALTDPPAPAVKSLDVLGDQVGALARRVHDFLQVTRTDQLERGDVDAAERAPLARRLVRERRWQAANFTQNLPTS